MRRMALWGIVMLLLCSIAFAYPASMTYEINPCVSKPFGNETPIGITLTAYACEDSTDPWNYCDKVQAKVALYYGDANIQWQSYDAAWYNSHQEFYFDDFDINKTGDYIMRFYVRSNDTDFLWNYTDISFSVVDTTDYEVNPLNYTDETRSYEYSWFGDCTSTGLVGDTGTGVDGGDGVTATLEGIEEEYGWGAALVWVLIMIIVAVVLWFNTAEFGSATGLGIIVLVEICLLIVGMYLGFVPAWILYTLLFVGVFGAGFKIYQMIGGK